MNACEKNTFMCVVKKLSDKLTRKKNDPLLKDDPPPITPIQVNAKSVKYDKEYISFSFNYKSVNYTVNITNSFPNYDSLFNEKIKNVTITATMLTILSVSNPIPYTCEVSKINELGLFAMKNNPKVKVLTVTGSTATNFSVVIDNNINFSINLEGKMRGGNKQGKSLSVKTGPTGVPDINVDRIHYIIYNSKYILFTFLYQTTHYSVKIYNSLPDYNSLQNKKITNVVITNKNLIISFVSGKPYNYTGQYMAGNFFINSDAVVNITSIDFNNSKPKLSFPSNLNFSINFTNIHTIVNN